jgi:hypothetical protein
MHLARVQRRALDRRRLRVLFVRFFNIRVVAIGVAIMALAWILALAGAAFAVRTVLILCFATLAGRAQRVGVPVPVVRRNRRRRRISR